MNEAAFGASIFATFAFAIGAVLFVRRAIARERETSARLGLCRSCTYNLAGLPAPVVCPECGTATERPTPAPAADPAGVCRPRNPNLASLLVIPVAILPFLPILIATCDSRAGVWLFVGTVLAIPYAILLAVMISQVKRVRPLPFAIFSIGISTLLLVLSILCFYDVLFGTDAQSAISMFAVPILGSPFVLVTFGIFVLVTKHPRFLRHPSQR